MVTFERADVSGAAHTRKTGWNILVSGNIVGPIFKTRKEARAWANAMGL